MSDGHLCDNADQRICMYVYQQSHRFIYKNLNRDKYKHEYARTDTHMPVVKIAR